VAPSRAARMAPKRVGPISVLPARRRGPAQADGDAADPAMFVTALRAGMWEPDDTFLVDTGLQAFRILAIDCAAPGVLAGPRSRHLRMGAAGIEPDFPRSRRGSGLAAASVPSRDPGVPRLT
jgi:hypothetical protein